MRTRACGYASDHASEERESRRVNANSGMAAWRYGGDAAAEQRWRPAARRVWCTEEQRSSGVAVQQVETAAVLFDGQAKQQWQRGVAAWRLCGGLGGGDRPTVASGSRW